MTALHTRDVALVFQNHVLFPHMAPFENVVFGLRMRRLPRYEIVARGRGVDPRAVADLGMCRPTQLSGGRHQRVALARALVVRPRLPLLDEPLSNLDARSCDEPSEEIRVLQQRLGVTTVLVTHDIQEAFAMSDRVGVMQAGRIEQIGEPGQLYHQPATQFLCRIPGADQPVPYRCDQRARSSAFLVSRDARGTAETSVPSCHLAFDFARARGWPGNHFIMNMTAFAAPTILSGESATVASMLAFQINLEQLDCQLGARRGSARADLAVVGLAQLLAVRRRPT
jgi:ABC-type sulfate/molybdate transport systems ATPase subunit